MLIKALIIITRRLGPNAPDSTISTVRPAWPWPKSPHDETLHRGGARAGTVTPGGGTRPTPRRPTPWRAWRATITSAYGGTRGSAGIYLRYAGWFDQTPVQELEAGGGDEEERLRLAARAAGTASRWRGPRWRVRRSTQRRPSRRSPRRPSTQGRRRGIRRGVPASGGRRSTEWRASAGELPADTTL